MATVTVSGVVKDETGRKDSRDWKAFSPVYREGASGEVLTMRQQKVRVVAGVFTAELEPGVCVIENPDGQRYTVTVPDEDADLWGIIATAVAFPPNTEAEALASAVNAYLDDNPPAADWNGLINIPAVIGAGATQAAARAAIGAPDPTLVDTAANLASSNPIPAVGRRVRESDTGKWKTGDGATHYNDLPYDPSVAEVAAKYTKPADGVPLSDMKMSDLDGRNKATQRISPQPSYTKTAARVTQGLQTWLKWLADNSATGAITEIGVPERTPSDTYHWVKVAESWWETISSVDVPVNQWTDAGWFAAITATNGLYNKLSESGAPLVRHTRDNAIRSFQVGGVVGVSPPGGFNNSNPVTAVNWWPDIASYVWLASVGVTAVRISARWEVLQPTLNAALDTTQITNLKAQIAAANAAGLSVIVDACHNYASYIMSSGTKRFGDGTLAQAHLVDYWTRLSTALKSTAGIYAYELMNEPAALGGGSYVTTTSGSGTITPGASVAVGTTAPFPGSGRVFGVKIGSQLVSATVADSTHLTIVDAQNIGSTWSSSAVVYSASLQWEDISQAVVTAIRGNTDTTRILVAGYDYSAASRWAWNHPVAWITDSGSNFRYTAHHYWSSSASSDADYDISFSQEEANATLAGPAAVRSVVGFPPPSGAPRARLHLSQEQTMQGIWTARGAFGTDPAALTSGYMNLTYARVRRGETVSKLVQRTRTAASTTPTLFKLAVFSVAANGFHTLLWSSASTTSWATNAFTEFSADISPTLNLREGQLIAIGVLCVMPSGAGPVITGVGGTAWGQDAWPPLFMAKAGLSDIPAYLDPSALTTTNAQQLAHWIY